MNPASQLAGAARKLAQLSLAPLNFVAGRLSLRRAPGVAALAPGEGGIVAAGGDKLAVYRDDAGELHAVSPICTHLRCVVRFNPEERTWDCPCHGSRFGIDGEVLRGPARSPLKSRQVA